MAEPFAVFRALHVLAAAIWAGAGLYGALIAPHADRVRHGTFMATIGGAALLFGFGILGTARERYTPEAMGDAFMRLNIAMSLALIAWILAAIHWWLVRRPARDPVTRRRARAIDHSSLACLLGALVFMLALRL